MRKIWLNLSTGNPVYRHNLVHFKEGDPPGGGGGGGAGDPPAEESEETNRGIDYTKKMAESMGKTGNENDPPPGETEEQKTARLLKEEEAKKGGGGATAAAADVTDAYAAFDTLKQMYPDVELPEKGTITKENSMQELIKTIAGNMDVYSALDPKVAALQTQIDEGTSFEDAIKFYAPAASAQTPEDKVKAYFKSKYNLKDEELPKYMKDINIEKEALEADVYFKNQGDLLARQKQVTEAREREAEQRKNAVEIETGIKSTVTNFQKKNEVLGVKLTAEHKAKFNETYRNWVTPGPNGEPAPIVMLLNDDGVLGDVIFMLSNNTAVKDQLDIQSEALKKFFRERLGIEPQRPKSSKDGVDNTTGGLDIEQLRLPARD